MDSRQNRNVTNSSHTISVKHQFGVSVEQAFNAWTKPMLLDQWLGPRGYKMKVLVHNLLVGGNWRFRMNATNGNCYHYYGTFVEISPPTRLIFTWASEEHIDGWRDKNGNPTIVTIDFIPISFGVEIVVNHENLVTGNAIQLLRYAWFDSLVSLDSLFVVRGIQNEKK